MQIRENEKMSSTLFKEWRKHSGALRQKLSISAGFKGWTRDSGASLCGLPAIDRVIDCIDVAWASRMAQFPIGTPLKVMKKDFWCNPSQGVQRKPWGDKGTIAGSGIWYSYEHDTTLDGIDFLRLHGFPDLVDMRGISDNEAKDLGGEAYSLPISTAFATAFYYLPWGSWWKQGSV